LCPVEGERELNFGFHLTRSVEVSSECSYEHSLVKFYLSERLPRVTTYCYAGSSPLKRRDDDGRKGASHQVGDRQISSRDFAAASNYSFTFVTLTTGSVSGFSADKFTLNTGAFQNPLTGTWSVGQSGSNLTLNYTGASAIPESSTYAMIVGAAMLGFAVWRRRKIAAVASLAGRCACP